MVLSMLLTLVDVVRESSHGEENKLIEEVNEIYQSVEFDIRDI